MDRFEELEPGHDEFPLGPHPLAFVAVLGAVLFLAYLSTNMFFERVGATSIDGGPALAEVPEVQGLDVEAARAELEALGFAVEIESIPNANLPDGEVIAQIPTAGSRISTDRAVELTVSAGSEFVSVPDVRGSPFSELNLMLFSHRVALGEVTERESDLDAGEVISQEPGGGEIVAVGTPIDVVVSTGPPIIEIPDVSEMEPHVAANTLRSAGFDVVYEDRYSWRVRRGLVIGTDPEDEAPRGSRLTVEVSRGPAPPRPTAPPTTESTSDGQSTVEPTQPSQPSQPGSTTTTRPRPSGPPEGTSNTPDGRGNEQDDASAQTPQPPDQLDP